MLNDSLLKEAVKEVDESTEKQLVANIIYRLYYDAMNGSVEAAKFFINTVRDGQRS